jgi:predicted dehydrogenase
VWDLAPHDFSILRYWLEETPTHVSALSRSCIIPGVPDVAFIDLAYGSGTIAHVELSWLAPSKLRRTAIVGSDRMVVYDDTSRESVRIFDSGASLPDPESFGEYRLSYRTGDIVSPRIDATEPLSIELAEFCSAIINQTPLLSSPQVGVDVVRMMEAVDSSLASGGHPVSLEGQPELMEAPDGRFVEEHRPDVSSKASHGRALRAGRPAPRPESTSEPEASTLG